MRTRHQDSEGNPRYTNRLVNTESPYLIQHGHNPVDWFPWGAEPFARARAEDKPLFLSVGYATCHWCHVMERESFDDEAVAKVLNRDFIAVKLDREQHPDVDELYMSALQLMTGRGGWPISCFLMPDGKPFFAGTYFPRADFLRLLERIVKVWRENREGLEESARQLAERVQYYTSAAGEAGEVAETLVRTTAESMLAELDSDLGGFGAAPKFPQEPRLLFLLEEVRRGEFDLPPAVTTTLNRMCEGGIFDQIGGGFHRYTVDAAWQVPHFEKMLYNQAQMLQIYAEGFAQTGEPAWRGVAEQICEFLMRELRDEKTGLFFSAIDADSEGEEGRFYIWSGEEVRQALPPELADLAADLYGFTRGGNFEGKTIPHLDGSLRQFAERHAMAMDDLLLAVSRIRKQLYKAREMRSRPLTDEKILVGWNGMVIAGLVAAETAIGTGRCLSLATAAGESLWERAWSDDTGMARALFRGRVSVAGTLEDYALPGQAFLALYDATGAGDWLERASRLAERMCALFRDGEKHGFYMGPGTGDAPLIARAKSPMDGATTSANSAAIQFLAALAERTGIPEWRERALEAVDAFSGLVRAVPHGFPSLLTAVRRLQKGEASPCRYSAGGRIRVRACAERAAGAARFTVQIEIAEGWYVAAHDSGAEAGAHCELRAAASDWNVAALEYPPSESLALSYDGVPRRVWRGRVAISGIAVRSAGPPDWLPLRVTLIGCCDTHCMTPDLLEFRLPLSGL